MIIMRKKIDMVELLERMSKEDIQKRALLFREQYKNVFDRLAKL